MGYPIERFEGEVDDEFICSICHDVVKKPLQTPCEHMFCSECIRPWLEGDDSCPVDRSPMTAPQLKPIHRTVRVLMHRLRLSCDFADQGCDAVVQLDALDSHVGECAMNPEAEVTCEAGCGTTILRNQLQDHDCIQSLRDNFKERMSHLDEITVKLQTTQEEVLQKDQELKNKNEELKESKGVITSLQKELLNKEKVNLTLQLDLMKIRSKTEHVSLNYPTEILRGVLPLPGVFRHTRKQGTGNTEEVRLSYIGNSEAQVRKLTSVGNVPKGELSYVADLSQPIYLEPYQQDSIKCIIEASSKTQQQQCQKKSLVGQHFELYHGCHGTPPEWDKIIPSICVTRFPGRMQFSDGPEFKNPTWKAGHWVIFSQDMMGFLVLNSKNKIMMMYNRYTCSDGITDSQGVVKWFDCVKKYGFITPENSEEEDVYFRESVVMFGSGSECLAAGERVAYTWERDSKNRKHFCTWVATPTGGDFEATGCKCGKKPTQG